MKVRYIGIILVVAPLLLLGCKTASLESKDKSEFQKISLGINAVEEECWAETGSMAYELLDAERVYNIYCGDWEWPSARIYEVAENRPSLEYWLNDNRRWKHLLDIRMHCAYEEHLPTKILDGLDAILLNCKLRNGEWPYLALVTSMAGKTYLVDGVPSTLGVVETLFAKFQDIESLAIHASPAMAYVYKQYEKWLYGADDLKNYYWSMVLGQYYNSVKEFAKADEEYTKALEIHQKKVQGQDVDAIMHIALEESNQGHFIQAEQGFEIVNGLLDQYSNPSDYARFISYLAIHKANQGKFNEALKYAQEATKLRKSVIEADSLSWNMQTGNTTEVSKSEGGLLLGEEKPQTIELAHSLYIEAAMQDCLGEAAPCDQVLERARAIVTEAGNAPPLWRPQLENLYAVIEDSRYRLDEAEKAHEIASQLFEKRAPQERPTALSYLDWGNTYVKANRNDEALDNFREAVTLIRKRNQRLSATQITPYLDLLLDRAKMQPENQQALFREMFDVAQLVHGSITAQDIARTVARFSKQDDEIGVLIRQVQETEQKRIRNRQNYQALMIDVLNPDLSQDLKALSDELDIIDNELASLNEKLQTVSPRYLQVLNSPATENDVISTLRNNEGLLHILVGKTKSFVFFLAEGKVQAYSVDIGESYLESTIDKIKDNVINSSQATDADIIIANITHQLYEKLLNPVKDEVIKLSYLVVVSSGPLLNLPFGLFATEAADYRDSSKSDQQIPIAWLGRHVDISHVPSAQSFVYLRRLQTKSAAPKTLIAFGGFLSEFTKPENADMATAEMIQVCMSDKPPYYLYSKSMNLPGTQQEVLSVANLFPDGSDIFLEYDFNEPEVKVQNLDDYRILYFATHALLPGERYCLPEPALVTSLRLSDEKTSQGFITMQEILDFKLNADLVVLSACNTGGAANLGGESLSGLARAFFFSGARSLVVSHWKVDDAATTDLMLHFFKNLRAESGISLSEALSKAKIELMDHPKQPHWSHPYYWAAFSVIGDGSSVMDGL